MPQMTLLTPSISTTESEDNRQRPQLRELLCQRGRLADPLPLSLSILHTRAKVPSEHVRHALNVTEMSAIGRVVAQGFRCIIDARLHKHATTGDATGGSNPPTQAEVQALRDNCEELADDVRALSTLVHALRGGG
jgi:hypothetical protein